MSISGMGRLLMNANCPVDSSGSYRSMFFQNGTAAVKIVYEKDHITPDSITQSAASCGFLSSDTISGIFQKIQSCICSYCIADQNDCMDLSSLELYAINTTSEDNDCLISNLENCPGMGMAAGITLLATLGLCIVGGIAYCCRSRITKCVASCRRDRTYQVLN